MRTHKIFKSTLQKESRTSRTRKTSHNTIRGCDCNGSLSILNEENEPGFRNIGMRSMDSRVSVPHQYCARNGEDFAIFHFLKTSLTLLIKNSQTLVKTWFGLTTNRLHTELKRMESTKRWSEEKEGTSTMWAHLGWMKNGGRESVRCSSAIYATCKIRWQVGSLFMNGDWKLHSV